MARKAANRMEGESTPSFELTDAQARKVEGRLADALRACPERPKPIDRVMAALGVFEQVASGEFAEGGDDQAPATDGGDSTTKEGEAG